MKTRFISLTLCISVLLVCIAGCANGTNTNDSIVTISMSDEAEKYEEEELAQDGVKAMLGEGYFEQVIEALSGRSGQEFPQCKVQNTLDSMEVQGSKVYSLANKDYANVVLYIHGGAWTFEISEEHISFCDDLASRLNAKVYMPLYPLSPEAGSEETYAMIEALYKEILKEEKNVYIMGDSAGGNITLGLMYEIKAENLTKPKKMILISPCTDMSFSNQDIEELNKTDPELDLYGSLRSAELWAGKENLKNPKNSALYADVSGYPDTMIFQGTNDIVCPDNLLFYQKMNDAGVNVTLVKGEGLWHVFPIYPIPERAEALDLIEAFCAK